MYSCFWLLTFQHYFLRCIYVAVVSQYLTFIALLYDCITICPSNLVLMDSWNYYWTMLLWRFSVHAFQWTYACMSLGVEVLGHCVYMCVSSVDIAKLFPKEVSYINLHSQQQHIWIPHVHKYLGLSVFFILAIVSAVYQYLIIQFKF